MAGFGFQNTDVNYSILVVRVLLAGRMSRNMVQQVVHSDFLAVRLKVLFLVRSLIGLG